MMQFLFYLQTVLYRFAQFFISPLLNEGSVDREIQAVESGKFNFPQQPVTDTKIFLYIVFTLQ